MFPAVTTGCFDNTGIRKATLLAVREVFDADILNMEVAVLEPQTALDVPSSPPE